MKRHGNSYGLARRTPAAGCIVIETMVASAKYFRPTTRREV